MSLVVVPTGSANTASVIAGLRRGGGNPVVTARLEDVATSNQLVLPGVGSFGAAIDSLDSYELRDLLVDRIDDGRPTLAICVGLQLLALGSEESPGRAGLGVVHENVCRIPGGVRVPQIGWNRVVPDQGTAMLTPGWAYFANSFRLTRIPEGWVGATSEYGGPFVAGLERGAVLACQFHPELSGAWGTGLIRSWLERTSG